MRPAPGGRRRIHRTLEVAFPVQGLAARQGHCRSKFAASAARMREGGVIRLEARSNSCSRRSTGRQCDFESRNRSGTLGLCICYIDFPMNSRLIRILIVVVGVGRRIVRSVLSSRDLDSQHSLSHQSSAEMRCASRPECLAPTIADIRVGQGGVRGQRAERRVLDDARGQPPAGAPENSRQNSGSALDGSDVSRRLRPPLLPRSRISGRSTTKSASS